MRALPAGLVTFCFVDVVGSTRAFQADPERYPHALREHHGRVADAFVAENGVIVETEGDGLFAAFDNGSAAVRGCLEAQLALYGEPWTSGMQLTSRMGLHAGPATPIDDGYVSLAVHQAARVAAAANAGQLLCSASVAREVLGRIPAPSVLVELGRFRLKDFDLPETLFELRHPELPGPYPAPRAPRVVAGNLRLSRTSFVGRDAEVRQLRELITGNRLVSILGPGGVGKTRLAYRIAGEFADSFADGAWVVELESVTDPNLVADAVARELPLPSMAGGSLAANVGAYLATRRLLLVLDNCEHVLDGAADFVDRLFDAAPDVTVVATSRRPLTVVGEVQFQLEPFPPAAAGTGAADLLHIDAVRLFAARATAARRGFVLSDANADAVATVCRRLDGLPLAIELAAARIASCTPGELLDRLDERFSLLSTTARGVPERQRTLLATLEWSFHLLSPAAQTLLTRLTVFAGRFAIDWPEQVCAFGDVPGPQVLGLIDELVRNSLIVGVVIDEHTEYELLHTIHDYAAYQLRERGESDEVQRRRADFLVRHLKMPDPIFQFSARTAGYLDSVAALADDVRAALRWCLSTGDAATACALVATVYRWWNVTGRIGELVPIAAAAVARPVAPTFERAVTYYALLIALEATGADSGMRQRYCDELLELARRLADDNALALALYCQADFPLEAGDYPAAVALLHDAAAAATRAGSQSLAATIRRSETEARAGDSAAALAGSLDDVVAEFRQTEDPYGLAVTLAVLAGAELASGQAGRAGGHALEGLHIALRHGYVEVGWRHWTLLACAAVARGEIELGGRLLGAVEAELTRSGGTVGAGQGGSADRALACDLITRAVGVERLRTLLAEGAQLDENAALEAVAVLGERPA